jgi:hypothetical protein
MIRRAAPADRAAILAAATALAKAHYPQMKQDFPKMAGVISEAVSSAQHFCWVCEEEGRVRAVLLALTSPNIWAEKRCCTALLWVSDVPGVGMELLREFARWVRGRKGIKVAGFSPDVDVDPRTWALVERVGFRKSGGSYLLYN